MSTSSISIEMQVLHSKKMTIVVSAAAVHTQRRSHRFNARLFNHTPLVLVDDEFEEEVNLDDARHVLRFIRQFATDSLATVEGRGY